jgi:hypothetical protein
MRRGVRRGAAWEAACRLEGATVAGAILDISAHGVFFALADPSAIERLRRLIVVDARVALRFESAPGLEGLELPGRIRWTGVSATHGRVGFGVEFSHRPLV